MDLNLMEEKGGLLVMIEFGFFRGGYKYCFHHCMLTEAEAELIKSGNTYGFYHPDRNELQAYEVFGTFTVEIYAKKTPYSTIADKIMVAFDAKSAPWTLKDYRDFFDYMCCEFCDDTLQELSQGKSKVFKVVKTFEPMQIGEM